MPVDKTWNFKHNDERITYEQYVQLEKEHAVWVAEQAKLALIKAKAAEEDIPKRRKKK